MSRYLGPIYKKSRRLNTSLLGTSQELKNQKRNTKRRSRKRLSAFGIQLNEKQKLRFRYFLSEKQLRNFFVKIRKMPGEKGENLLFNLERRLDNLVYRTGFASTRREARQIVNHKQILVNGKTVNIPSYLVQINDIVAVKKSKVRKNAHFKNIFSKKTISSAFGFLVIDPKNHAFQLVRLPNKTDFKQDIRLPLIVEYYNRYL